MSRNGFRWNINECLRLQREFELLNLSLDEIAFRHGRTVNAIMFRLDYEGFANYTQLYNDYYAISNEKNRCYESEDDDDDYSQEEEEDGDYSEEEDDEEEEEEEIDIYDILRQMKNMQTQINELISKHINTNTNSNTYIYA